MSLSFVLPSVGLLTPVEMAYIRGGSRQGFKSSVAAESSEEEESSPVSPSIGSPTEAQYQPRDFIYVYSHAVFPATGLPRTPVLQTVPRG